MILILAGHCPFAFAIILPSKAGIDVWVSLMKQVEFDCTQISLELFSHMLEVKF